MASQVLRRRAVTALATYGGTVLGVLGTILATHLLSTAEFGRLTLAIAAAGFFQLLLDTTVEEAVVKYGFRYSTAGDWGRLRRLFRTGLAVKWGGGALAALAVAALAPFSAQVFGTDDLVAPMLVAALIPLAQAPEGIAGASMLVAGRYDVRALFSALAMALRLVGIVAGASIGVTAAVAGVLLAQVVASSASGLAGGLLFRRYPRAPLRELGEDRRAIGRFVLQSGLGTSLVSMRQTLAPLMLGIVSSPSQVAFFRAGQAPLTGLSALSSPFRLILLTEQTRDFERGEVGRMYRLLRRYTVVALGVSAVVVPVFWIAMPTLVDWVYPDRYGPATDGARLLLLAAAVQLVFGWTKSFPVSIGRPGLRIVAHGVEIAVLLPLLLVLGARWDATGAAAGYLAGTLAFAGVWTLLLVRLRRQPLVALPQREALAP